jgi:hypothetical protein
MIMKLCRNLRACALAPAVATVALMLTSGPAQARQPDDATVSSAPTAAVLDTPTAMFASLRQRPSGSVPAAVGRAIAFMPSSPGGFAIDPSQVRRTDVSGQAIYVAPMAGGLCVFIADGSSACSEDLDSIAKDGLGLQDVPPIRGPINPMDPASIAAPSGPTTLYGIAPDGVDSVAATTTSGAKADATVHDNAFIVVTDHPIVNLELRR